MKLYFLLISYQLNAQNFFVYIILHSSTCLEQYYVHPQVKSYVQVERELKDCQSSLNLCTARPPRTLIESNDTKCCIHTI